MDSKNIKKYNNRNIKPTSGKGLGERTVRAKKHLGQHFLKDESIAEKIANTLTFTGYQNILEIGPGTGVLTKYLIGKEMNMAAMELDWDSVAYLNEHFSSPNLQIIEADFLKYDITSLFNGKPFAIIGNFPYNISTQIVFKALENKEFIPEFTGMFQKEVAQRICEKEGSKAYGILSVLTQAFYEAEYLFTVSPSVFNPPPKVESGVLRLTRKEDFSLPCSEKMLFKVVKAAFQQRRKTLRNSLKTFNLSAEIKEDSIFGKRPEQLSVLQFIALTQTIEKDAISTDH